MVESFSAKQKYWEVLRNSEADSCCMLALHAMDRASDTDSVEKQGVFERHPS